MQLPVDEKERAKLIEYLRTRKADEAFKGILVKWFKTQLEMMDQQNRVIGSENKVSGAQVLAYILETIAASQAPTTDRNSSGAGAESESATLIV